MSSIEFYRIYGVGGRLFLVIFTTTKIVFYNYVHSVEFNSEKLSYLCMLQNVFSHRPPLQNHNQKLEKLPQMSEPSRAVADPGFSPGGGANSQKCYYFSIFCRKLHENERIWTPRGGARVPGAPPWIRQCRVYY